jgi:hypothetical protein
MTLSTEDRLAIVDLVTRADAAATARDADRYLECFTDNPRLVGAMGEHVGSDDLRRAVGPIWAAEGEATAHLSLNVVVDEVDRERATVHSLLVILGATPPFPVVGVSAITQQVVNIGPEWRIELRAVGEVGSGRPGSSPGAT